MIKEYNKNNDEDNLLFFLNTYNNGNFYYTKNNTRVPIKNKEDVRDFLKDCSYVAVSDDKDMDGVLAIWKAEGNGVNRNFLKLLTDDAGIAEKLLSFLFWNRNEELFIKIARNSSLVRVLRDKKFVFLKNRGKEILLYRGKSK